MTRIALRAVFYIIFAILLAELMRWELRLAHTGLQYSEYGYVQWGQSLFLLAGTVLLFMKAYRSDGWRQLAVCMALFFSMLFIRENDQILELVLPHGSWKYIVAVPLLVAAVYYWRHRRVVHEQLIDYARTASFGILLSGLVVLAFSRLFGRSSYWKQVMGDDYIRVVKNAAEEGVEFLALGLVMMAAVEFLPVKRPNG